MDARQPAKPRMRGLSLALLLGGMWLAGNRASAHETDNFRLPLDGEMAELDDFLGAVHTWAIEEAVKEVNRSIERALAKKDPAARNRQLEACQKPDVLAAAVASKFGDAFTETHRAGRVLRGSWAQQAFPGKTVSHRSISMNAAGHFPLDPRVFIMLFQADTIKAYGVYFGTDKLTHFHQLGWAYYKLYRSLLGRGLGKEEAYRKVLASFARTRFLAEGNLFGTIGTGVYSNADMAVNHVGFKFFLNLTETVSLEGRECEPLVVRTGVFWRVNHHVRPQSGWLAVFVSDHWNEALNPSLYDVTMRPRIRRVLRNRATPIVQFYTGKDGRPNNASYFEQLAGELSTYYGEPYGHSGHMEKLMNIGDTCFPVLVEQNAHADSNR